MSESTKQPETPPEPEAPRPAEEAGQQQRADDTKVFCDLCGTEMYEWHCRIVCSACGYNRDCSDP